MLGNENSKIMGSPKRIHTVLYFLSVPLTYVSSVEEAEVPEQRMYF